MVLGWKRQHDSHCPVTPQWELVPGSEGPSWTLSMLPGTQGAAAWMFEVQQREKLHCRDNGCATKMRHMALEMAIPRQCWGTQDQAQEGKQ